jgi:hypothetical protein
VVAMRTAMRVMRNRQSKNDLFIFLLLDFRFFGTPTSQIITDYTQIQKINTIGL